MPQMSPYNWLTLNILFTLIFLIYIILIHFCPQTLKNLPAPKHYFSTKKFSIKW